MIRRAGAALLVTLPLLLLAPLAGMARAEDWVGVQSYGFAAVLNPDAVEAQVIAGARKTERREKSLLFGETYASGGAIARLNPAFGRVGVIGEIQPVAVFRMTASVEYVQYFDTFASAQSYPTPLAAFSDAARHRSEERAYPLGAVRLFLEPGVQAKVGPVGGRYRVSVERWHANLREGDTVFYASTTDTLVPDGGWVLTDIADAFVFLGPEWLAGVRWTQTRPLYDEEHFGDDPRRPGGLNAHRRAGVLAVWLPKREWDGWKPYLFALASVYLDHRFRADDDAERATPYLFVGVSVESRLRR